MIARAVTIETHYKLLDAGTKCDVMKSSRKCSVFHRSYGTFSD